ncbi:hypothetical protein [Geodermatophilus sp. URMC 64]
MAWQKVSWYSLGFNIVDKQCYFYFGLEGDPSARQIFVSAAELSVLADMFRNEGPVSYNSEGNYFVTDQEKIGEGENVQRVDA